MRQFSTHYNLGTIEERLAHYIKVMPNGCHEWQGSRKKLYGYIYYNGKHTRVHRLVWELAHGPIPYRKIVRHKCNNPPCCNIQHLRLGTQKNNADDRKLAGTHWQSSKTHCPANHEYTKENTMMHKGSRECRKCIRLRSANYRLRKRDE